MAYYNDAKEGLLSVVLADEVMKPRVYEQLRGITIR